MASGAQPCSNQRSSRKSRRHAGPCSPDDVRHFHDQCVVCGDRACSHHYYGVAACHGCKCFFWRSVKTNAHYVCRFSGNCAIDVNGRNTCRRCRFDRCLKAGMKPEAVRMEKQLSSKSKSEGAKRAECNSDVSECAEMVFKAEVFGNGEHSPEPGVQSFEDYELMNSLVEMDRCIAAGIERPTNIPSAQNLREAFAEPYRLDHDRIPILLSQLNNVDFSFIQKSRRRMLVGAIDWIEFLTKFEVPPSTEEKVLLLRNCFAPLTVFELCTLSAQITAEAAKLGLSTEYSFTASSELLSCCFLNSRLVESMFAMLIKPLCLLQLDEKEIAMIKAVIILNPEIEGLLSATAKEVSVFSDRVHNSLYHHCTEHYVNSTATIRFAKLLHLLSKIAMMATQFEEHLQVTHAFYPAQTGDPLVRELLGDIFNDHVVPLSCSRSASFEGSDGRYSTSPTFLELDESS